MTDNPSHILLVKLTLLFPGTLISQAMFTLQARFVVYYILCSV